MLNKLYYIKLTLSVLPCRAYSLCAPRWLTCLCFQTNLICIIATTMDDVVYGVLSKFDIGDIIELQKCNYHQHKLPMNEMYVMSL